MWYSVPEGGRTMGRFLILRNDNGVRFQLRAGNGEVIAVSETYTILASCKNGIESIRRSAGKAKLEDQTEPGWSKRTNPKFEVFRDKAGEYRFRLRSRNGEIIASSQGYSAHDACLHGIESVRENAPEAAVEFE